MYPFIALSWMPPNRRASIAAGVLQRTLESAHPRWERTFESDGMAVFSQAPRAADLRAYSLPGCGGVILGRLFPTDPDLCTPGWKPNLTEWDLARYLDSSGRQLTKDYWGAYIAFLTDTRNSHNLVVRDPSGRLPCCRLLHEDVDIFFADVSALTLLRLPARAPNLRYLAASIYCSSLRIRETALRDVTEILAGEGFERRGEAGRQMTVWDPRRVTDGPRESRFDEAASRLRGVTQACIDAWASVQHSVLHRLSGGFDSSVVLGCLSRTPSAPSVACLNQYVEDDEGDEREHARLAAARAGARLIEIAADPRTLAFDERLLAMPPATKPSCSQCVRLLQVEAVSLEARRHGADAVWTGQGGDHLFLKSSGIASAGDFAADYGLRWKLVHAVRDEARLSALPYAWVVQSVLAPSRSPRRSRQSSMGEIAEHFIDPEALPADVDEYSAHPWTLAADGLPPGRRRQIELLADVVNRHRPLSQLEWRYEHHPLLSQPIVEQCLRTPTYLHLAGGRHRALARHAFRDCVPHQIIDREDKGATTQLTVESLRRSARFLCELLLDGVLAREHLFARDQLERCLRDGQALTSGQLSPLLACIAAEVWIRAWQGAARAAPAIRSK